MAFLSSERWLGQTWQLEIHASRETAKPALPTQGRVEACCTSIQARYTEAPVRCVQQLVVPKCTMVSQPQNESEVETELEPSRTQSI